jgi:maltose alpha-D-glucosyltransferase/alpha-amylase
MDAITAPAAEPTLAPITDPLWFKDAIVYQIHPKSFFDANNDGVGDFQGILAKLDYIAELGVTAIWMLPFYPSPRRDDGYDIAEYRDVHPEYGTMDDLKRLIEAAHARGLKVITELVVNHTSDQHPLFQRARRAPPGSPERDYYVWSDTDEKYDGTRIIFLDTEKSNWTWDDEAKAYFWHRFYSHQPDLNFDNPAVVEEVLDVMRFWLDVGVDGLRLDAVPYLVEREGTNNENLPETHAVLKTIRAEMDRYAPGRMLLAEANQWPEDAQVYFGDGDECHMSFHFPLMPRMYMAIAREDRFPITDIMRQTPEIPANCQWAVFLRNHDELTLEMVTSSERDYLWQTYASDRRARLNLGIRRRLAPLLERDRRRIELMNGLLLSMPGTPVIYYGDEIAMGDNIFLGDRDGVRTPMQWSVDRNGGFSRADPARLVLPPIQDPIYGFQAVNVEAQASDPYSLLNWMRRMLAVRSSTKAFGRGTLRFLYPSNRKVLAYLREYAHDDGTAETLLCVSNLSRTAQAVQLDLSAYTGRVPVDMIGGSAFPAVGAMPYLLTLPPFEFFWFKLAADADLPAGQGAPVPEPLPEYATLVMRREAETLTAQSQAVLQTEVLPAYLAKRRWFASKGEPLRGARIAYGAELPTAPGIYLTEVEAELPGRTERYVLPLGVAWEDEPTGALALPLALSRVRRGARVGYLTDAFALDPFARGMLTALAASAQIGAGDGTIEFRPAPRFAEVVPPDDAEIRRLSAEQSNSSLIVGDSVVLKIVRRMTPGIHPEAEMTRYLTERGYGNSAPLYGEAVRVDADGASSTIALAQGFVRNQGDAWGWTLDFLARGVEDLALTGADGEVAEADVLAPYALFAAAIGRRLGELHALLAQPTDDPDFRPSPADDPARDAWAAGAAEQLRGAFAALRSVTDRPEEARETVEWLLAREDALMAAADQLAHAGGHALLTRVHGDFHLGQVLVVGDDAYIIDFEGEPARPLEQRRALNSPLRDVAGLLRSFEYAAAAAAPGRVAASETTTERRQVLLRLFQEQASAAFLDAYRAVLADAQPRWVSPEAEAPLLDLFLLEKAAYEVRYEAANRPAWLPIPLNGLRAIAARLLGEDLA